MVRANQAAPAQTVHERETDKIKRKGRDDEGNDVFHRDADHVLRLHESNFIANEARLHKEDETGADQNPDMIDIQSVSPAFLNHYNARGPDKKVSFCQFGEYIANEKRRAAKRLSASVL